MGFAAGFLAETIAKTDAYNGISIGILFFLVSYYFARFVWYKGINKKFQGKVYTTGLGGYVLAFLFTWVLLFTLVSV